MPYKNGGGNHLQYYDEDNGKYDDGIKAKLNEDDKSALAMFHYFGLTYDDLIFHWPLFNLHDQEYCDMFVKYSRKYIDRCVIDFKKMEYLLTFQIANDKSKFLNNIGYNTNNLQKLMLDIQYSTDLNTLTFSHFSKNCFRCLAKTTLNGKIVTSVWELKRNFIIRFITLIPGGDKRWK